jgi:hypothetical protein
MPGEPACLATSESQALPIQTDPVGPPPLRAGPSRSRDGRDAAAEATPDLCVGQQSISVKSHTGRRRPLRGKKVHPSRTTSTESKWLFVLVRLTSGPTAPAPSDVRSSARPTSSRACATNGQPRQLADRSLGSPRAHRSTTCRCQKADAGTARRQRRVGVTPPRVAGPGVIAGQVERHDADRAWVRAVHS